MVADRPLSTILRKDVAMDFAAAGLLDDLEGKDREAREKLLEELAAEGFSLDDLKTAAAEDRLALLPVERVLGGRYTATEIEERTGLPAQTLLRLRRILGLPEAGPDDRVFGDEDIEMAQSTRRFLDIGLGEQAIAEITRVLGEAMARLAATTAAAFVDAFLEPGDTEYDVAMRFAALAEEMTPTLHPVLIASYNAHLRESVRRGMISRHELEAGSFAGAQEMTVCFADLVGFTRLGNEVEAHELGTVAGRLAELAGDVTEPPVRLVKTIGDAAMFVSPDAGALVSTALALIDAVEDAELPPARAGLASGPVLQRAGDFYGHAVNLASRVTGIARPGSVLCTKEVHDVAVDGFEWSSAGKHRLKGLSEAVTLYRAREPAEQDAEDRQDDHDARGAKKRGEREVTRPKADRRRKRGSN
jgi:adenylate cyclase